MKLIDTGRVNTIDQAPTTATPITYDVLDPTYRDNNNSPDNNQNEVIQFKHIDFVDAPNENEFINFQLQNHQVQKSLNT